jgi:hypothetical protein
MVLIKNKKQGTVWDIADPAHANRLLANPKDYEGVEVVEKKVEKPKE